MSIDEMNIDQLRELVRDIQLALDCAGEGEELVEAACYAYDAVLDRRNRMSVGNVRNRDFYTRR